MVRKLPAALDIEEFKLLIQNTKRHDHKTAFLLGFGAGLRLSEIVGDKDNGKIPPLSKEQIDVPNKRIRITGKGGVDRIVPIPKGFKEYMIELLPLNKNYKSIASARRSIERIFKISAKKAGLLEKKPGLHFHSLRHGFGSRLANQGVPVHHIRTLMGHSNIATTNIYLEANPKQALKDYEDMF